MDISKCFLELKLDLNSKVPLYLQIGEYIEEMIREGVLKPLEKLPPERDLSNLFGVSRTTSINAYRYLEKKGYVQTKVGSGTYVVRKEQEFTPSAMPWSQLYVPFSQTSQADVLKELVSASYAHDHISLAAGMPDPHLYPLEIMHSLMGEELPQVTPADFGHIATEGYWPLRSEIRQMCQKKGIKAKQEEIMVLSGSQQGLYLMSKVFVEPGDYVIVENPTYIGAIQAFQKAGAKLLTVPYSEQLDLALIEDYLIRYRPKLFYILPTYQNPTGRVLSIDERQQLIRLAARHRLVIVEDDAYGELYYSSKTPPPSLKSMDSYGGVVYLGTFSKILFPGLRTGWIVAAGDVIQRLSLEKQYIDLHSNNLAQWLLTQYLNYGYLDGHLQTVRDEYRKRRDALIQALNRYCQDELQYTVPEGGFYVWGTVLANCSPRIMLYEAGLQGVSFVPGEAFYAQSPSIHQIRLCFTAHSPDRLTEAVRRLSKALKNAAKRRHHEKAEPATNIPIL